MCIITLWPFGQSPPTRICVSLYTIANKHNVSYHEDRNSGAADAGTASWLRCTGCLLVVRLTAGQLRQIGLRGVSLLPEISRRQHTPASSDGLSQFDYIRSFWRTNKLPTKLSWSKERVQQRFGLPVCVRLSTYVRVLSYRPRRRRRRRRRWWWWWWFRIDNWLLCAKVRLLLALWAGED